MKKIETRPEVYARFKHSYGAWNVLALMLSQFEFVKMQALNKFCYQVSISRV